LFEQESDTVVVLGICERAKGELSTVVNARSRKATTLNVKN